MNEDHTHYSIELRHPSGIFETQFELIPISFHHKTRDLAVLHLINEQNVIDVLKSLKFPIFELATEDELIKYGGVSVLHFFYTSKFLYFTYFLNFHFFSFH